MPKRRRTCARQFDGKARLANGSEKDKKRCKKDGQEEKNSTTGRSERSSDAVLNSGEEQRILEEVCPDLPYEIIDLIIDFELDDPRAITHKIEGDYHDILQAAWAKIEKEEDGGRRVDLRMCLFAAYTLWRRCLTDQSYIEEWYGRGLAFMSFDLRDRNNATRTCLYNLPRATVCSLIPPWARQYVKKDESRYYCICVIRGLDEGNYVGRFKFCLETWHRISSGASCFEDVVERVFAEYK